MAATTITGQQALYAVAQEVGETRTEYITSATSTTVFIVRGLSNLPNDTFLHALAQIKGKGIRAVTAWSRQTETLTVASGFDTAGAAGDPIQLLGWDARARQELWDAVNEAIRLSWPFWYQETTVLAASSTITLATATENYALPTDCDGLIAVGIQTASTAPVRWVRPTNKLTGQVYYRVEGSPGALVVRFEPNFNKSGGFHQYYDGQKLCTWYAKREPIMTAESSTNGTTQLPAEYFSSVAAEIYRRRKMGENPDAVRESLASLQELSAGVLKRLGYGKRPINALADEFTSQEE